MSDKQGQLIAESRGYWGYRELTEEELKRVSGGGCGCGGGGDGGGDGGDGGADDGSDSAAADTSSQNNDGTEATDHGESPVSTSPTGPAVDNRDGTTSIAVTGPNGIDPSSVTTVGPDAREGGEDQP